MPQYYCIDLMLEINLKVKQVAKLRALVCTVHWLITGESVREI